MTTNTAPKELRPPMIFPTRTGWRAQFSRAAHAAALAVVALALAPHPVQARVWFSIGWPFPSYYPGPGPYYNYPAPYASAPPQDYYYPPAEYPAAGAYPPPSGPSPSAYTPPAYDPSYNYPAPYASAPPQDYYYPPAEYPAAGAYPPPSGPSPSAYTPPAYDPSYNQPYNPPAGWTARPAIGTPPADAAAPAIKPRVTYTNKPAFINSAGQTCREYKTTGAGAGRAGDVLGTACKAADGQWRVVN